jgi:molecular chaperone DnaJ
VTPAATDYYEVLGVARGADAAEIKRAFRARARHLHPDVSSDPDAEERFRELADAYAALSKPASRLLYDRFGYRGRGARERARRRPANATVGEVELGFYEAARGGRRSVPYTARATCAFCENEACATCDGRGTLRESLDDGDIRVLQLVTCADCGGSGRAAGACEYCDGTGEVKVAGQAEITIPAGVEDGARIRVGRDGEEVVVRVKPQPRDPAALRFAAALGLVAALGFLAFLLLG